MGTADELLGAVRRATKAFERDVQETHELASSFSKWSAALQVRNFSVKHSTCMLRD